MRALAAAVYMLKTAALFLPLLIFSMEVFAANARPPITIKADVVTYDSVAGVSTAQGNVVITQEDGEARAARAEYNLNTREGFLEGGVIAAKGEASLSADRLFIRGEGRLTAEGSAWVARAGSSVSAPRVDYWSERGYAKTSGGRGTLVESAENRLSADSIEYDLKQGVGTAEGNVDIALKNGITGAGDKAVYTAGADGAQGEITLSGNAWLVQDGNKIIGDLLIVNVARETFEGKGQVRLDLPVKQKTPPQDAPGAADGNKDASGSGG
jgi:lipopolysaccharide export system protein LptA